MGRVFVAALLVATLPACIFAAPFEQAKVARATASEELGCSEDALERVYDSRRAVYRYRCGGRETRLRCMTGPVNTMCYRAD